MLEAGDICLFGNGFIVKYLGGIEFIFILAEGTPKGRWHNISILTKLTFSELLTRELEIDKFQTQANLDKFIKEYFIGLCTL